MDNLITLILICAATALVINVLLKKLQVESVIGYILTGILVGALFQLEKNHSLSLIAEFGIVFLMFTIGLEFSPQKLHLMRKEVFLFGPLQVLTSAGLFFAIGHYGFALPIQTNLIVSLSLSLSSTAIVLNLLTKARKTGSAYGRNSVGILLFQDIAVIPILILVAILSNQQASLGGLLIDFSISAVAVLLLLFVGARFLTPHIMEQVIGSRSNELFVIGILLFVVGAAQLAHYLGLSYSLGAFLAGMVISETHYKHQVEADLTPFRDLLLGVFFITVGMQVNPLFIWENSLSILLVMVILLAIKASVLFILMRLFSGTRTSVKTALLLAQCGEFSFVVFETAQANGLFMSPELGQVLIMAIILTMMMTPFIFRNLDSLTDRLSAQPKDPNIDNEPIPLVDEEQVVICGFGHFGQRVASHLEQAGIAYLAIEHDSHSVREAQSASQTVIYGNATQAQLLESAHIEQARAAIIAMSNEQRILSVAQAIRRTAPQLPIIVCTANPQLKNELTQIGVDLPIDSLEEASLALAGAVIEQD